MSSVSMEKTKRSVAAMSLARLVARFAGLAAAAALAGPGSPGAQHLTTPANPDSAVAVVLGRLEGAPLRLEDAIRTALDGGSTAARRAAAVLAAARGTHRREKGSFDPELFLNVDRIEEDRPTASPFAGAPVLETKRTAGTGGARIRLPIGTEIEASLDAAKNETNSIYAALNPEYGATGRIAVRQPLLRGLGPGTGSEAKATGRESEAAAARYDDVVLGVRALVEQTYWDLYAAERDLVVQTLIREQAAALSTQAQLRARSGLVGPADVAIARVFFAEQEQSVLDREEELDRISDRLAALIGRRPPGGLPRYRPVDEPPGDFAILPEDSVVALAERENRELRARERDWAAARARERGAAWNRFPTLDFLASLGGNGLAGTDTAGVERGFGSAWSQVRDREFPAWSAGVRVSVPIFLREGRGEHQRLEAEAERAAQDHEEHRRVLEQDVRAAHRALVRASRRLEAATRGVEASREQVRIGVLQYNSGRTTAFELVRLGADLAAAQQRHSQALVRTARAAAALRFLTSSAYPASTSNGEDTQP